MTQKYTLTSRRKQGQQKCCVSECNINAPWETNGCCYNALKEMIVNDDKFGFIQLYNVYQIIFFLQFSTETTYAVADNAHVDI